jgi:chromosome segregation ATPase
MKCRPSTSNSCPHLLQEITEERKSQKKEIRDLKRNHGKVLERRKELVQNLVQVRQEVSRQSKDSEKVSAKASTYGVAKRSLRRQLNNKLDELKPLKSRVKELQEECDRLKNKRGDYKIMTNK